VQSGCGHGGSAFGHAQPNEQRGEKSPQKLDQEQDQDQQDQRLDYDGTQGIPEHPDLFDILAYFTVNGFHRAPRALNHGESFGGGKNLEFFSHARVF
jgi:hypothetical protein